MERRTWLVVVAGATCMLALVGVAAAVTHATKLRGSVGPGFGISLRNAEGADVTRVAPGEVELEVEDKADEHNFHLTGPGGVDVGTTVDAVETRTFALTLVDGTYSFICDVHPLTMKGSFAVGTATTPPPPPPPPPSPPPPPPPSGQAPSAPIGSRLVLTGGPGAVLSLKTVAGKPVKRLRPGAYRVTARDRSATRGLRLRGAGAQRATTAAFVGTTIWKVTLRKGTLTYLTQPQSGSARRTVTVG
jgi:plastocyanin